jgi:hypothetical protein
MNSKPAFQEFVEANQALLACYNAVSVDDYKKLSESARENLCSQPKEKLREIMRGNQLVMSNLIKERVEIL